MAFGHGTDADFYLNGFDATGFCNTVGEEAEIETAETTTLGKTAKNYIPGLEDATVSFEGFYDGDAAADATTFSIKLNALRRTVTEATYIPQSDILGNANYFIQGELTSHSIETAVDDAGTFEAEMQSNTGYERGRTVHVKEAETVTGTETGIDNTTSSANGGSGLLQVFAVSGSAGPTLTAKIQHSSDSTNGVDGTWVDLITFAAKTAAGTSERAAVTGTVNRWVRAQFTIAGTTPSFTFHLSFSRK